MIKKFHIDSQAAMTSAINRHQAFGNRGSNMRHIGDCIDEALNFWNKSEEEQREEYLRLIQQRRQLVKEQPENLWQVYELCKDIYELAELDLVDFNGASYIEKLNLIRIIVPFADPEALAEGVAEYHESRVRENWKMSFLEVQNDRETIQPVAGTDC